MKAKLFLFVLTLTIAVTVTPQTKKAGYEGLVQAGLLEGERGSAFQLQTVQGVKYKTWSAGIGAGLDYYHTRSIPLFFDLRKSFSQKSKGAFIYADGGYNFLWLTTADKGGFVEETKGGLYWAAGIGYALPVFKSQKLFFDIGFSQKRFSKVEDTMPYLSIWPPPASAYEKLTYSLNRLSIKTGLSF